MGLYQYIREQKHRDDLIGELGRWLASHPGDQPDLNSLAFSLAAQEYEACRNWTRLDSVTWLNENEEFQRIVKIEPRLGEVVSDVIRTEAKRGYSRATEYSGFKARISKLVGSHAMKKQLRNPTSYDALINIISKLLPPDANELYPNGLPDDIELDL